MPTQWLFSSDSDVNKFQRCKVIATNFARDQGIPRQCSIVSGKDLRNFERTWKQSSKWWWARWFMLVGQQLWVKSLESWESRRLDPHLPPNHLIPPFPHSQVKLVFRSHKSLCSFPCFPWAFCPLSVLFVSSLSLLAQLTYSSFNSMTLHALCPGSSYFIILSRETPK